MKKALFFVLILIGILFFSTSDYFFNTRGTATKLPSDVPLDTNIDSSNIAPQPNLTQAMLNSDESQFNYQVVSRTRSKEIFERIDLSDVENLSVFRNELEPLPSATIKAVPIVVYEIQGPLGQGSITYLAVKLKFIRQKDVSENINEIGEYGQNSFFFNDSNYPETAFLVTQIGDNIFAFQYSKPETSAFKVVTSMIRLWSNQIKVN